MWESKNLDLGPFPHFVTCPEKIKEPKYSFKKLNLGARTKTLWGEEVISIWKIT